MNEPNNAPYRTLKTIGLFLKANDNKVSESFWLNVTGEWNTLPQKKVSIRNIRHLPV